MEQLLTNSQVEEIVANGLRSLRLERKRVLVIVPDNTRTMPVPLFFRLINQHLGGVAKKLDFLIALGTHPPLSEAELLKHFAITSAERSEKYAQVGLFNHAWKDPASLTTLGVIPAREMAVLTEGRMAMDVEVRLNRLVLDYDEVLICGPVFPHEVVGFSGGNKYFFPGIAGQEIIDFTHWLGALITCHTIIGTRDTPVRQVIDRAAALIPTPRHAFCCVVTHAGIAGCYFGTPEEAFRAAVDLSAQVLIRRVAQPYRQVLAVLPEMYTEVWVGGKGMYKLEPVVADSGELTLYAPHIHEISQTHGHVIRQIGYHVLDYYLKQWDKFKHFPWGVLGHSTQLRGIGEYDATTGIETPRIQVTLATSLSAEDCRSINLGYRNPASIDPAEWERRNDPGVLVVRSAGETLYRLANHEKPG
jgi:nickel-dependent lactate racemase